MVELASLPRDAVADRGPPGAELDPHDLVHGIVEGVFGLIFPDPQARRQLGLKAISRAAHGGMAWYVWTTDRAGAYEISLASELAADVPGSVVLALRYFPDPSEPVFRQFAAIERDVRQSSLFDRTGTPVFATADEIEPKLFCIGGIALVSQGRDRFTLHAHSPDRWIEEAAEGGRWVRQRDVPGVDLALTLIDALVGGIVYLGHSAPASARVWRRSGATLRIDSDGSAHLLHDPAISEWELELSGLAMPGRTLGYDAAFAAPPRAEAPWFVHASAVAPAGAPWPVNLLWWRAADWHFDPVGMFCGHCAAEEADGHLHIHTPHCEDAHHDCLT